MAVFDGIQGLHEECARLGVQECVCLRVCKLGGNFQCCLMNSVSAFDL